VHVVVNVVNDFVACIMVFTGIEVSLREGFIFFFLSLRLIELLAPVGMTVLITGAGETVRPVGDASAQMLMVVGRPALVRYVIGR
jgi:hypothetical protein